MAVVIWSLVGLVLFSIVFSALYFFKRELGGFEVKPGDWVAPISKTFSSDLPETESDFEDYN